jgi:hypothetical protein
MRMPLCAAVESWSELALVVHALLDSLSSWGDASGLVYCVQYSQLYDAKRLQRFSISLTYCNIITVVLLPEYIKLLLSHLVQYALHSLAHAYQWRGVLNRSPSVVVIIQK